MHMQTHRYGQKTKIHTHTHPHTHAEIDACTHAYTYYHTQAYIHSYTDMHTKDIKIKYRIYTYHYCIQEMMIKCLTIYTLSFCCMHGILD